MEKLFNKDGWTLSSRFTSISAGWRYLGPIVLASTFVVQGEALAQKEPSVDLSPLVAKSTVTSHANSVKEISVKFLEEHARQGQRMSQALAYAY